MNLPSEKTGSNRRRTKLGKIYKRRRLSQSKRRPALVVSTLEGNDIILCQITSKTITDNYSVSIDDTDFVSGRLKQSGNIRSNRIFTADSSIILYRIGSITKDKLRQLIDRIIEIITG